MKNINVGLVRLYQFVVFVFFTFIVLTYFGALLLIPLDAVYLLIKVMSAVGFNALVATLIAVPVVIYLGLSVYKIPGFFNMLIEIGVGLIDSGKSRIEEFNKLAEAEKS